MATALLAGALALSGCGKSDKAAGGAGGSAAGGGAAPTKVAAPDPDRAEQGKLQAAIECLNRHSGRVFEVRDGYLNTVDPATGAASANRKPVLMGLAGHEQCKRKVGEAAALTPAVPTLDERSAAYVTALENLARDWDALKAYYDKGENLDDKGAKAGELHQTAMAAFEAFGQAHGALDDEVRTLNRKRRVADLAAREKAEGRKLEVIIDNMMLEAETAIEAVMRKDTPAADLDAATQRYGALVDEVDAYARANPGEVKRGSMTNLTNYSRGFLAAAKVVGRKRADGAEPTDGEREAALSQFNSLVDNYNHH